MTPEALKTSQSDLLQPRLSEILNPRHVLVLLGKAIPWEGLEEEFKGLFREHTGHPPKPVRLMIGLLMLQHMEGLSDEQVVRKWVENPYWQLFCGYDHLQWKLPCDSSSLVRWRKRLGTSGMEKILSATVQTAIATKAVEPKELERVIVDTTVMEKAIAYPTDSRLLNRCREKLVALAATEGVVLRQSYRHVGKTLAWQVSRYAHAKQFKRMKKSLKKLHGYLGRVVRDIERKIAANPLQQQVFTELLALAHCLLLQKKDSKNKLYSLHAPEVYCVAKGKIRHPYEYGCKVSLVVTHASGLALSSQALEENTYDGHTLEQSLTHAETITGTAIIRAFVDKGYKGHGAEHREIYLSGQKRGITKALKKQLKRRAAIEPHIGHMKEEGNLRRNHLKGSIGDKINASLCAIGHNLRLILRHFRWLFVLFITWIAQILLGETAKTTV